MKFVTWVTVRLQPWWWPRMTSQAWGSRSASNGGRSPFAANSPIRYHACNMDAQQFARITRALADPQRLEILERVAGSKELACSQLAVDCPVSQPTISHHIKELVGAGLIRARRQSKYFFYTLDRAVWSAYLAEMRRRVPLKHRKS